MAIHPRRIRKMYEENAPEIYWVKPVFYSLGHSPLRPR